jgi:hypothetical protein
VNKQTGVILALAAGCLVGAVIGYAWHAPGKTATWDDIRNWLTAAAILIGVPATVYQLRLQRQQLRDQQYVIQDEVKRNHRRDELLDGQLRELQQRDQFAAREQAEQIDLTWNRDGPGTFALVINDSRRPIRDITCQIKNGPADRPAVPAEAAGEMALITTGEAEGWAVPLGGLIKGSRIPVIHRGGRGGFKFSSTQPEQDGSRLIARFTDDAGLHWELDNGLHLQQITNRGDL